MTTENRNEIIQSATTPPPLPVAPASPPPQDAVLASMGQQELTYFTPLKASSQGDKILLYRAIQQTDTQFADLLGRRVKLRTFVCFPVQLADETTGETYTAVRSVLILDDGRTVGCVSEGVLRALKALASINGMGPWSPPLDVECRQIQLRGKNRYFTLDWVAPETAPLEAKEDKRRGK